MHFLNLWNLISRPNFFVNCLWFIFGTRNYSLEAAYRSQNMVILWLSLKKATGPGCMIDRYAKRRFFLVQIGHLVLFSFKNEPTFGPLNLKIVKMTHFWTPKTPSPVRNPKIDFLRHEFRGPKLGEELMGALFRKMAFLAISKIRKFGIRNRAFGTKRP